MDLLQEPGFSEEAFAGYMIYNWCSCLFSSICSFNGASGGCVWIGGSCAFGGTANCNYQSCGNTTTE